jgi:branched-chain amino acid transport system ATP-binding protein
MGERSGNAAARWTIDQMFELFPKLRERADAPAGVLSGGEQQMLTICRTLMGNPGLIMIDEPTEGLAPMMVELVGGLIRKIAERGTAVLLVEQKLTIALQVSRRLYVMGHGKIVFEGSPQELEANRAVRQEWLEV